jgi:hypothetical protein
MYALWVILRWDLVVRALRVRMHCCRYKGLGASLCGIVPYASVDLGVYFSLKEYLASKEGAGDPGVPTLCDPDAHGCSCKQRLRCFAFRACYLQACMWHYIINVWNAGFVSAAASSDKTSGDWTSSACPQLYRSDQSLSKNWFVSGQTDTLPCTQGMPKYTGIWDCVKRTVQQDGVTGL